MYEAPDVELVNELVEELVSYLKAPSKEPAIVRAAMAHLNFTMIHPFSDGNGRLARALQTLVIAGDGILHPVFSSIEEWLGDNTQEYYDVLGLVGKGKWNPANNALPWLRFCLKAHYQQAAKLIRRNEEAEALYNEIIKLIQLYSLNERVWLPLFDAALGMRVTNPRYRKDAEISEFTAGRDLKKLCEVELLVPEGERKMRTYGASQMLLDARKSIRLKKVVDDPYELIQRRPRKLIVDPAQAELPGL